MGIWLSESVIKPFVWWGCYDVVFFLACAPRQDAKINHEITRKHCDPEVVCQVWKLQGKVILL